MATANPVLEPCVLRGDVVQIPKGSIVQEHVFRYIFSDRTWKTVLSDEDRDRLRKLLPPGDVKEQDSAVHKLFNLQNIKFGNPLKRFHKSLKRNQLHPESYYYRVLKRKSLYKAYKQKVLQQHSESLQTLLVLRQRYLDEIQNLPADDVALELNSKWRDTARGVVNITSSDVDGKAKSLYRRVIGSVKRHCADGYDSDTSEEDTGTDDSEELNVAASLCRHHKRRLNKEIAPTLDTRNTSILDVIDRTLNDRHDSEEEPEIPHPATPTSLLPPKKSKPKSLLPPEKKIKLKSSKSDDQSNAASSITKSQPSFVPHHNMLSLLRQVMSSSSSSSPSISYRDMTETEIATELNQWQETEAAKHCSWTSLIQNWEPHVKDVLQVLAENPIGPLVVYTPSEHWKWAGDVDDSKVRLNTEWARVIQKLPSLALIMGEVGGFQEEDRPESQHGDIFQKQEALRFSHPHRCFTYRLDGKEYIVGPVKGVYDKLTHNSSNKAREHTLLVNDRPSYVTILTLVRDAAARLPKGEGTRYEICDLLKQSQFISATATDNHINTVVSGALDRLHYEKDPCVKFDSARKNWVYLHGGRTADEFEMLHQAQGAALKAKKAAKPSKFAQASRAAALSANKSTGTGSSETKPLPPSGSSRRTPVTPPLAGMSLQKETELAEQSIMGIDSMSALIPPSLSEPFPLTAAQVPQTKPPPVQQPRIQPPQAPVTQAKHPQAKAQSKAAPLSHQMKGIKLEPSAANTGRLLGIQMVNPQSNPQSVLANQMSHLVHSSNQKSSPSTNMHLARQISAPAPSTSAEFNQRELAAQRANHNKSVTPETAGKNAVFYQRISTQSGKQPATLMHRIMGSPSGTPVLARLVQTPGGGQKIAGAVTSGGQLTRVQLPGGEQLTLPITMGAAAAGSRAVQIVSSSNPAEQSRPNLIQVQNVTLGGAKAAVGGAKSNIGGAVPSMGGAIQGGPMTQRAVQSAVKTLNQQGMYSHMKVSNIQQKRTPTSTKGASLLTGHTDPKTGQVQLVKALISSAEGKPGSQAYILTSNSAQKTSMLTTKSSATKSAMIARVLQPDGTLKAAVHTGIPIGPTTASSKSVPTILTAVSSPGMKKGSIPQRGSTPLLVRQVHPSLPSPLIIHSPAANKPHILKGQRPAGQSSIVNISSSGEIPKKIEQSELSPSTELDVESDS